MVKEKATLQSFTPNELLLTTLRDGHSDIYAELSVVEWEEVTQLAARFGVMPLLYQQLRHINMPSETACPLGIAKRYKNA